MNEPKKENIFLKNDSNTAKSTLPSIADDTKEKQFNDGISTLIEDRFSPSQDEACKSTQVATIEQPKLEIAEQIKSKTLTDLANDPKVKFEQKQQFLDLASKFFKLRTEASEKFKATELFASKSTTEVKLLTNKYSETKKLLLSQKTQIEELPQRIRKLEDSIEPTKNIFQIAKQHCSKQQTLHSSSSHLAQIENFKESLDKRVSAISKIKIQLVNSIGTLKSFRDCLEKGEPHKISSGVGSIFGRNANANFLDSRNARSDFSDLMSHQDGSARSSIFKNIKSPSESSSRSYQLEQHKFFSTPTSDRLKSNKISFDIDFLSPDFESELRKCGLQSAQTSKYIPETNQFQREESSRQVFTTFKQQANLAKLEQDHSFLNLIGDFLSKKESILQNLNDSIIQARCRKISGQKSRDDLRQSASGPSKSKTSINLNFFGFDCTGMKASQIGQDKETEEQSLLDLQKKQMNDLKLAGLFCRVRMDLSLNKEFIEPKKVEPPLASQNLQQTKNTPVPSPLNGPQTKISSHGALNQGKLSSAMTTSNPTPLLDTPATQEIDQTKPKILTAQDTAKKDETASATKLTQKTEGLFESKSIKASAPLLEEKKTALVQAPLASNQITTNKLFTKDKSEEGSSSSLGGIFGKITQKPKADLFSKTPQSDLFSKPPQGEPNPKNTSAQAEPQKSVELENKQTKNMNDKDKDTLDMNGKSPANLEDAGIVSTPIKAKSGTLFGPEKAGVNTKPEQKGMFGSKIPENSTAKTSIFNNEGQGQIPQGGSLFGGLKTTAPTQATDGLFQDSKKETKLNVAQVESKQVVTNGKKNIFDTQSTPNQSKPLFGSEGDQKNSTSGNGQKQNNIFPPNTVSPAQNQSNNIFNSSSNNSLFNQQTQNKDISTGGGGMFSQEQKQNFMHASPQQTTVNSNPNQNPSNQQKSTGLMFGKTLFGQNNGQYTDPVSFLPMAYPYCQNAFKQQNQTQNTKKTFGSGTNLGSTQGSIFGNGTQGLGQGFLQPNSQPNIFGASQNNQNTNQTTNQAGQMQFGSSSGGALFGSSGTSGGFGMTGGFSGMAHQNSGNGNNNLNTGQNQQTANPGIFGIRN